MAHEHVDFDSPEMAAHAEAEAEVLYGLLPQAFDRLPVDPARILDVGCGPGVGTCALAQRWPAASVVAADGSAPMLARAAARAERLGLTIETRQVSLPEGLDDLVPADLVWASLVVHHVGDEADAIRRLARLVRPGGLLALVELDGPLRIAGDERWDALAPATQAWFDDMRHEIPGHKDTGHYPDLLADAGLEVVVDDIITLTVEAPLDAAARHHAEAHVERTRHMLEAYADPALLAALDVPADASLVASRHLYVARA